MKREYFQFWLFVLKKENPQMEYRCKYIDFKKFVSRLPIVILAIF